MAHFNNVDIMTINYNEDVKCCMQQKHNEMYLCRNACHAICNENELLT